MKWNKEHQRTKEHEADVAEEEKTTHIDESKEPPQVEVWNLVFVFPLQFWSKPNNSKSCEEVGQHHGSEVTGIIVAFNHLVLNIVVNVVIAISKEIYKSSKIVVIRLELRSKTEYKASYKDGCTYYSFIR